LMKLSAAAAAIFLFNNAALAEDAAKPTDPQIAHIVYTADQIDIAAAKQALSKSKNKEVIGFANKMIHDHSAVNKQALDLVNKLHVTPADNPTSQALQKQATEKLAELAKLKGRAFDRAYADNEVAYHKTVDGALENTLIPSASNPELKSLLETGLKIFDGHEKHAEKVAADVSQEAPHAKASRY
jgi:putative membrane protein